MYNPLLIQDDEDGMDYAPAFRKKKMSVQHVNHNRAATTLHGGRLVSNGDSAQKQAIRFKKVGNLMTIEQNFEGGAARSSSLNK